MKEAVVEDHRQQQIGSATRNAARLQPVGVDAGEIGDLAPVDALQGQHTGRCQVPVHPRNVNWSSPCKVLGDALHIVRFMVVIKLGTQRLREFLRDADQIVVAGRIPVRLAR